MPNTRRLSAPKLVKRRPHLLHLPRLALVKHVDPDHLAELVDPRSVGPGGGERNAEGAVLPARWNQNGRTTRSGVSKLDEVVVRHRLSAIASLAWGNGHLP